MNDKSADRLPRAGRATGTFRVPSVDSSPSHPKVRFGDAE